MNPTSRRNFVFRSSGKRAIVRLSVAAEPVGHGDREDPAQRGPDLAGRGVADAALAVAVADRERSDLVPGAQHVRDGLAQVDVTAVLHLVAEQLLHDRGTVETVPGR